MAPGTAAARATAVAMGVSDVIEEVGNIGTGLSGGGDSAKNVIQDGLFRNNSESYCIRKTVFSCIRG